MGSAASKPATSRIDILDALIGPRPTGLKRPKGTESDLFSDSDLILEDQEKLLSILMEMNELGHLDQTGFDLALGGKSTKAQSAARHVAWGSWLIDVMLPIKALMESLMISDWDKVKCNPESINNHFSEFLLREEHQKNLYVRAMGQIPIEISYLKPPFPAFKVFCTMYNGTWYRELEDAKQKIYLSQRDLDSEGAPKKPAPHIADTLHEWEVIGLSEVLEEFVVDKEFIDASRCLLSIEYPCKIKPLLPNIRKTEVALDLSLNQSHCHRLAPHSADVWLAPLTYLRSDTDWEFEGGVDDYRDICARELQVLARKNKIAEENGSWPLGKFYPNNEYYNAGEEFEADLLDRRFFALDLDGLHQDDDMFFGCELGYLERRRYVGIGPMQLWENTHIPMALKFCRDTGRSDGFFLVNPCVIEKGRFYKYEEREVRQTRGIFNTCRQIDMDLIKELFTNNAYARLIGDHIVQGSEGLSIRRKGSQLCLELPTSDVKNMCQPHRVAHRLTWYDGLKKFISFDVTHPELHIPSADIIRRKDAVPPDTAHYYMTREHETCMRPDDFIQKRYKDLRDKTSEHGSKVNFDHKVSLDNAEYFNDFHTDC